MQLLSTRKRRRSALVAAVAVVAIGGGVGYAFWTSTGGTGDGTATTGTSAGFTVTSTASTDPALTPGGPPQSVPFTVTNDSTGTANLTAVAVTIVNANGTAWTFGAAPACTAADYTVGAVTVTAGPIAGGGNTTGTVSITMNETGVDQDSCQNANVPLHFEAS